MIALAPWLMDLFRGGKFHRADAAGTTRLFVILAITLALWAVQGIYARAFYAASDTKTPAITGTIITVLSIPMYAGLFQAMGMTGLAIASDIGILAQTASLAILLHKKRLVSLAHLEFGELTRAAAGAIAALAAAYILAHHMPPVTTHSGDVLIIAAGTTGWAIAAIAVLLLTKSTLPAQILRRRKA